MLYGAPFSLLEMREGEGEREKKIGKKEIGQKV